MIFSQSQLQMRLSQLIDTSKKRQVWVRWKALFSRSLFSASQIFELDLKSKLPAAESDQSWRAEIA